VDTELVLNDELEVVSDVLLVELVDSVELEDDEVDSVLLELEVDSELVVTDELDVEIDEVDSDVVVIDEDEVEIDVVVLSSPCPDSQPQTVKLPPAPLVVILKLLSGSLEHLGIGNGITIVESAAKTPL